MIKSTQIKIVLILIILAVVMFGAYGIYSIKLFQGLNAQGVTENVLTNQLHNLKIVFGILIISFVLISFIIIWFTRNTISKPILKLIQSAKSINVNVNVNDNF